MTATTLELRRRRWTLVLSVPFTVVMAMLGIYSMVAMLGGDRLAMLVGGCGVFGSFCVAGTVGKAAFAAWRGVGPAVVVDGRGVTDHRGGTGLIPWHDVQTVKLDDDERRILVNVVRSAASSGRVMTTARRLFGGADHAIALGGLRYDPRALAKALADNHRRGRHGIGVSRESAL